MRSGAAGALGPALVPFVGTIGLAVILAIVLAIARPALAAFLARGIGRAIGGGFAQRRLVGLRFADRGLDRRVDLGGNRRRFDSDLGGGLGGLGGLSRRREPARALRAAGADDCARCRGHGRPWRCDRDHRVRDGHGCCRLRLRLRRTLRRRCRRRRESCGSECRRRWSSCRWRRRTCRRPASTSMKVRPLRPARPVRPMRWT